MVVLNPTETIMIENAPIQQSAPISISLLRSTADFARQFPAVLTPPA
jgi:hypothetical protein